MRLVLGCGREGKLLDLGEIEVGGGRDPARAGLWRLVPLVFGQ